MVINLKKTGICIALVALFLAGCSSPKRCKNPISYGPDCVLYPEMSEEERLMKSDLFYCVSFNSFDKKTIEAGYNSSGFPLYFTAYNITIHEKYKGEIDLKKIYLRIDLNGCYTSGIDDKVELNQKYNVYLSYFEPIKGYRLFQHTPDCLYKV